MDPAFSLADELNFHDHDHNGLIDETELQFHPHPVHGSLDDEFAHLHQQSEYDDPSLSAAGASAGLSLDAELESLHLQPTSLSSELEADPHFSKFEASTSGSQTPGEEVGSTISALATSQTAEIGESMAATQTFLRHLSSLSCSNIAITTSAASGGGEGDTEILELSAARYLTLVSQCTAEREAQVRELREIDRKYSRLFASPSSSLPSSDSFVGGLPDLIEDETPSSSYFPSSPTSPTRQRGHAQQASISSDTTITETLPLSHSSDKPLLEGGLFAPLYTSTTSLLGSLTSLHEHTQITKSSTADAARKLKTLRGLIGQWKSEQDSVEISEDWIRTNGQNGARDGGERRGKQWIEEEVGEVERLIEAFEGTARGLLTPVSIASR